MSVAVIHDENQVHLELTLTRVFTAGHDDDLPLERLFPVRRCLNTACRKV